MRSELAHSSRCSLAASSRRWCAWSTRCGASYPLLVVCGDCLAWRELLARQLTRDSERLLLVDMDRGWMIPSEDIEVDESSHLGAGALGEVKRATWNTSTPVAIKRLFFMDTSPAALRAMGGALDDFTRAAVLRDVIRECSINWSLRHPNIVTFLGVGVDSISNEPRLIVTEFMERGNLHDELYPGGEVPRQGAPMALGRLASILLDVARALVYLHSRRPPMLHLDIKPTNVYIDRSGTAKVGDFGESRVFEGGETSTREAFGIGTPVYMAPEMAIQGGLRRSPVDMFSFGVMACEMSSGRPPNPGPQIVRVGTHYRLVPERERRAADIEAIQHREIRMLVEHLIEDDPDQRWSAKQVQSFLAPLAALGADSQIAPAPQQRGMASVASTLIIPPLIHSGSVFRYRHRCSPKNHRP